ncbi:hypothetical protein HGB25_01960 [Candidatus Saccharibacteria bacterium]|nr:hypothetical protein [Candidatus Saccharibacteria bacterium]
MTSEFGDGHGEWIEFDKQMFDPESDPRGKRVAADKKAVIAPTYDYFEEFKPDQPKFEVGQYVAENGFSVPLVETVADWQQAFDDGTAMLRSEMPQDYSGLSGLFSSEVLSESPLLRRTEGFRREVGNLIMRGLRDGLLDPTEYMMTLRTDLQGLHYSCWEREKLDNIETAMEFGAMDMLEIWRLSASHWRYVEGTNVSVFADPNVEGRYHFGVRPDNSFIVGHMVDTGEYDKPNPHRAANQGPFFIARPFIEYYEQIRNLPRFDKTQCPVLELKQDTKGDIHFLQYLKTNQRQQFTEPFDLPDGDDVLRLTCARGITPMSGETMRLYISPDYLEPGMVNQAIYSDERNGGGLKVQFSTKVARFILYDAWLSFKDNHNDASPLYRPPLAASIYSGAHNSPQLMNKVEQITGNRFSRQRNTQQGTPFVDIKVTSNGREATIESDWIKY